MGEGDFVSGRYSREHRWTFDGGAVVQASPTPAVVPEPFSNPACVDPEEAFVAAVASCHMLTFLHIAGRAGFSVIGYRDEAVGTMTKNAQGAYWISESTLNPAIEYAGNAPTEAELDDLHDQAHEHCFIANSIRTEVLVG
jgi:organic hydroperoxide reductase OsmC/OhrA